MPTWVGFTIIWNASASPVQLLADGVTLTVEITGTLPVLTVVKEAILPSPLAPRPVEVSSFVQLKAVLLTPPLKGMAVVASPLQMVWSFTASTVGVGCTVMLVVVGKPTQLLAVGVTVMVDVTVVLPVLVAVNEAILFPMPLAASPILVLSFVHVNVVKFTALLKLMASVAEPLHQV